MCCNDEEKVLLASFSLEGKVQLWWEAKEALFWIRRQPVTWDIFKAKLSKQYIPKAVTNQKVVEFYNLVQGNMTVAQYETKFTELLRYAPHMVADEEEKAKKFQRGLAPYI